jgi:hypothetical protein
VDPLPSPSTLPLPHPCCLPSSFLCPSCHLLLVSPFLSSLCISVFAFPALPPLHLFFRISFQNENSSIKVIILLVSFRATFNLQVSHLSTLSDNYPRCLPPATVSATAAFSTFRSTIAAHIAGVATLVSIRNMPHAHLELLHPYACFVHAEDFAHEVPKINTVVGLKAKKGNDNGSTTESAMLKCLCICTNQPQRKMSACGGRTEIRHRSRPSARRAATPWLCKELMPALRPGISQRAAPVRVLWRAARSTCVLLGLRHVCEYLQNKKIRPSYN